VDFAFLHVAAKVERLPETHPERIDSPWNLKQGTIPR
jgi:hypothetical protein